MELSSGTIKQGDQLNGNEKRKGTSIPTLMITVKNEMAQPVDEQIIPITGKTRKELTIFFSKIRFLPFSYVSFFSNSILDPTETATLQHIFSDAAYYLIKSGNEENISLAKAKVKFTWRQILY